MNLSIRVVLYTVLIVALGIIPLIFNQNYIIRNLCMSGLLIVAIVIYFDKKYRNKYIPSIPNWLILSIIILVFLLLGISLFA